MQVPTLFVPTGAWNFRAGVSADEVLDAARRAEVAGIDGLFAGDHLTFYGAGNDGLVNLAPIAAVTERVLLKTSVYLLALRHPTTVALQAAMLDQLCKGRLILGVGIGGEDPEEWWAGGVNPRTRAGRTNEAMQVLRGLWTERRVTFEGRYFHLPGVALEPKPFRPEGIPMLVGGRSDAALRRAARYGDGWTGIWLSVQRFRDAREKLDEWSAEAGREGVRLEMGMQFWMGVDRDAAQAREKVARRMEGFYKIPFERFEKYVPAGSPEAIVEFMLPYIEAGCRHANLVCANPTQEGVLEDALAVREALLKAVGA